MASDIFSVVSVDVIALVYDAEARAVRFGVHRRTTPPFEGELALPGVVVRSGERLAEAAARALAKLDLATAPAAIGQLRTFDEPARDPRGPSLSIAMWAAFSPMRPEGENTRPGADATTAAGQTARPVRETMGDRWARIDDPPGLAFDHDDIVGTTRPLIADLLWRDLDFTRALTGAEFSATDAVEITRQLTAAEPHRANLNRVLANLPGLEERGIAPTSGGGRPPKLWGWVRE